jgi:DNA polymerase
MTTAEYIYDKQFLAHGVGIAIDSSEPVWYPYSEGHEAIHSIDWTQVELIGHNLLFDGGILAFRYGYTPARYTDTAAMARCVLPFLRSHSLKNVAQYLDIGEKKIGALVQSRGKRNLNPEELGALGEYCKDDVRMCRGIRDVLHGNITSEEADLMDLTVRMFTQPKLQLDPDRLQAIIDEKEETRDRLVKASGVGLSTLRSTQRLVAYLQSLGVDIPTKPSPKDPDKTIYTFQRDLPAVQLLTQHSNPKVRAVINARLEVMASLDLKRAQRMLNVFNATKGAFPVPLNHYAAHTGRWGGTDKLNAQNLTRGGAIRKAIIAPPHHKVAAADLGQIEARLTAWLAEHDKLLAAFADPDTDPYKDMAAEVFRKKVEDIEDDERFVGKTLILSAGFGVGWKKLLHFFQTKRPDLGVTPHQAHEWIQTYRTKNFPIVMLWKKLQEYLDYMLAMEPGEEIQFKCLTFGNNYVRLPSGNYLMYPGLRYVEEETDSGDVRIQIEYDHKGHPQKLYGGRFTENIIQALARCIIGTSMNTIQKEVIQCSATVHDEIISVPHVSQADEILEQMIEIMVQPPVWAPDLPLSAEGAVADNYGDAK